MSRQPQRRCWSRRSWVASIYDMYVVLRPHSVLVRPGNRYTIYPRILCNLITSSVGICTWGNLTLIYFCLTHTIWRFGHVMSRPIAWPCHRWFGNKYLPRHMCMTNAWEWCVLSRTCMRWTLTRSRLYVHGTMMTHSHCIRTYVETRTTRLVINTVITRVRHTRGNIARQYDLGP